MKRFYEKLRTVPFGLFWAIVSVFYALVFVGAEFAGSPVGGLRGMVELAVQWCVVSVAAAAVIGLISVSRRVFAVFFPLVFIASSVAAYFKLTMGMSLTPTLVELAVMNDMSTWATVVSPLLVAVVLFAAAACCAVVYVRYSLVRPPRRRCLWVSVFALAAVAPIWPLTRFKAPVTARMPYNFGFSVWEYLINRQAVSEVRDTFDNVPAVSPDDAPAVLFVIGESLRPDHLQLNGYERATTPLLAANDAVVSVPRMWTTPCYTHVSVPHIVTRADSLTPGRAFVEQSFITLFRKAGYRTAWVSNQDAVDSYSYFMHEADELVVCNGGRSLYEFSKWLDVDMLPDIDRLLGRYGHGRFMVVVHSIGSHWWYPSHYPDSLALFKPEVDSRILSELTREQMINSYDNTIIATDLFLARLIERVASRNAVLIYVSDHGEALGEDGNYLHGDDYAPLHHTACLIWYSPLYAAKYPDKVAALRRNATLPWSTDAMFHTVLDAASVDTPVLDHQMSLMYGK